MYLSCQVTDNSNTISLTHLPSGTACSQTAWISTHHSLYCKPSISPPHFRDLSHQGWCVSTSSIRPAKEGKHLTNMLPYQGKGCRHLGTAFLVLFGRFDSLNFSDPYYHFSSWCVNLTHLEINVTLTCITEWV